MKPETVEKMKYGAWGLAVGAAIAITIGFTLGGWTTSKTTETMIKDAVLAGQAAICAAQFMKDLDYEEKLRDFEKTSGSWARAGFIEKGGWDKMPGQEKADRGVNRACVVELEKLIKK